MGRKKHCHMIEKCLGIPNLSNWIALVINVSIKL
jgi:hypothetical protein